MQNHSPWRLLISPPNNGFWNMAVDEALLFHAAQKTSLPTLRLFSWDVPTLSLGYSQSIKDVDLNKLKEKGWRCVRRPTGGKAILHIDELTYSITTALDEPLMAGSLLESYQRVSVALQKALQLLGVSTTADSQYNKPDNVEKFDPVCFQVPSNYEITWNHKKLIGSAQARKSGGVLQHGTLPLCGSLTRITEVLSYSSETEREKAKQNIRDHAVTLEDASGRIVSWQVAADAFVDGFKMETNIELFEMEMSNDEFQFTKELLNNKYSTDNWNHRI
jgi:lipoate-protein ligase A